MAFEYHSDHPINHNDFINGSPPFTHPFLARKSGHKIIITSEQKDITKKITFELHKDYKAKLHPIGINIDGLVRNISNQNKEQHQEIPGKKNELDTKHPANQSPPRLDPQTLKLTYIQARVPMFGDQLRSLTLYGDDIHRTNLFVDNKEKFDFYSCGVGIRNFGEIAKLSSNGSISFKLRIDPEFLPKIDQILEFVNLNSFFVE